MNSPAFNLIYADPPWTYADPCHSGERGACHKYPLMTLQVICALNVPAIAAPDCLLALWWVAPMPAEALEVVRAWGFELKTFKGFTWHKRTKNGLSHFGMGNWTRANTEDCLFATRGKIRRANAGVRQFIDAPLGEHSEKPAEARQRLVQLMGDIPRIELFARSKTPGWAAWGNEIESDVTLEFRRKQLALF
jgi:N6-adenosine-specific RNA methylase IME4